MNGIPYKVSFKLCTNETVNVVTDFSKLQLYQERWEHQDKRHVKEKLENDLGIKVKLDNNLCETYIYGKVHRLSFGTRRKLTKLGEVMSADLCGSFQEAFGKKVCGNFQI